MNYIDTQNLESYKIQAKDGDIGSVTNFYFDEDFFYVRYFIVNTESFLLRNLVLVSPVSVHNIDHDEKKLVLTVTKKELEDSPHLDSVDVISRQYEEAYNDHFNSPYYWGYGASAWALGPHDLPRAYYDHIKEKSMRVKEKKNLIKVAEKNNLRSSKEVCIYSVKGTDKEFGHIQGFILDPVTLSIDFIIIDTINFFPSKNVLLRPEWVEDISWQAKTVKFPFSKKVIKSAPSYKKGKINKELIDKTDEHFRKDLKQDTRANIFTVHDSRSRLKKYYEKELVEGQIPSSLFVVNVEDEQAKTLDQ